MCTAYCKLAKRKYTANSFVFFHCCWRKSNSTVVLIISPHRRMLCTSFLAVETWFLSYAGTVSFIFHFVLKYLRYLIAGQHEQVQMLLL